MANSTTPRFSVVLISAYFLALFVAACQNTITGPGSSSGELPRALTTQEKALIENSRSFNLEIFRNTVTYDPSENIIVSPLSISTALSMTLNGAKGETFDQMRQTLSFQGLDLKDINTGYQSLAELLTTVDPKVHMQIANSTWNDKNFVIEEEFKERLVEYYDAEARELDFSNPESADVINNWVSDKTNGLIPQIIGTIPPSTVMYLINAIYFKGDWMYQFDKEETKKETFYLENGEDITVDMMHQEGEFAHYFSDEVAVIDLPYGDSLYSMTLMMPADPDKKLNNFIEQDLTIENYETWIGNLESGQEVLLSMPKFKLEYKIKLNDILKGMGMEDAFDEYLADFTGIHPSGDLFISDVQHKTFIEVNEEGTEAAAVTSIGMDIVSAPPAFTANRPFVFVIREQNSGAVLFIGKVGNPAS